jgi:hypothetical protein
VIAKTPFFAAVIAVICASTALAASATFDAQTDRNRLNLNETLTLTLIADSDASGQPDVSPLAADFDILSRGESTMMQVFNGTIAHTRQWTLELAPKHAGRLMIPALALGAERSQPLEITVTATADDAAAGTKPMFVEAEADVLTPYVQQSLEYRVRLLFREQPLQPPQLSEPTADGATVERSGEDRNSETEINGQHYDVIERRYRLIPQRSGTVTIESPRLEAILPDRSASRSRDPFAELDQAFGGTLFQNFSGRGGRRVIERAEAVTLTVRPQPDGAGAHWLPAQSVQLSDEWTPSPPVFRVGEPVTRTLTITALGTTAALVPTLEMGTVDGAQVYADQPHSEDLRGMTAPTAVKSRKIALVPTRAGTLTLPEIRLAWWDIERDVPQVAVIPARSLEVLAAPNTPATVAPTPPAVAAPVAAAPAPAAAPTPPPAPPPLSAPSPTGADDHIIWWVGLALLFGILWVATLIWWWRERRTVTAAPASAAVSPATAAQRQLALRTARQQVEQACVAADARAARAALLAWGRARWPEQPPSGLRELSQQFNQVALATALLALDRAIYAPAESAWNGAAAWQVIAPQLTAAVEKSAKAGEPLPPLYPRY